jgi:BolA protein
VGEIAREIERRLRAALDPDRIDVRNDSALHRGHAGDDGSGESHFALTVVARAFAGQSRIARQRAVHAALGDLMPRIHALAITAAAPGELPATR